MAQTPQPKVLELERVVTVGAAEYATSAGIRLEDYNLIGVQVLARDLNPIPRFLENLPKGTEAVVGFRMSGAVTTRIDQVSERFPVTSYTVENSYAYGTALVRKSEADKPT